VLKHEYPDENTDLKDFDEFYSFRTYEIKKTHVVINWNGGGRYEGRILKDGIDFHTMISNRYNPRYEEFYKSSEHYDLYEFVQFHST